MAAGLDGASSWERLSLLWKSAKSGKEGSNQCLADLSAAMNALRGYIIRQRRFDLRKDFSQIVYLPPTHAMSAHTPGLHVMPLYDTAAHVNPYMTQQHM